jgi:hypothetical protein
MTRSPLRTLGVLALLVLAPCARAVTFQFHGTITSVQVFYNPGETLYPMPVAPVAVGDAFSGYLSGPDGPGIWGLGGASGSWFMGLGIGQPTIDDGRLGYGADAAGKFLRIELFDPAGGTDWQHGIFSASDRNGFPFAWWSFEATVTVPDRLPLGLPAALLGSLMWIRRMRSF